MKNNFKKSLIAILAFSLGVTLLGCDTTEDLPPTPTPPPIEDPDIPVVTAPEDYEWVVEPTYIKAGEISEGLCAVGNDTGGVWGYINMKGEMTVPLFWDEASPFEGGMAGVKSHNMYGMIESEGGIVMSTTFDAPLFFSDGLIVAKYDGQWGYMDMSGEPIIPFIYDDATPFVKGRAAVMKDGLWGAVDTTGALIVDTAWESTTILEDGTVALYSNGQWGLAAADGSIAIFPKYEEIKSLGGGIYAFRVQGLWGIVGSKGGQLAAAESYDIISCNDGEFLRLMGDTDRYVNYDMSDYAITLPENVTIEGGFINGMAPVVNELGEWGIWSLSEDYVITPVMTEAITAEEFEAYIKTGALRTNDGFFGMASGFEAASLPFIDEEGNVFAMLLKDGLWGLAKLEVAEVEQ